MPHLRTLLATCLLCAGGLPAHAEVYVYQGPGGERLVTDRPVNDSRYRMVSRRDTVQHAGAIAASRPIATGGPWQFRQHIRAASRRFGVDATLVEAVIAVESGFDPNAVSSKGAAGLMQLMRATADRYAVQDRFNPRQNIYGGVEHLGHLMTRFNGKLTLVLAAYNAGAGAVERYEGIPPFPETRRYVDKVLKQHVEYLRRPLAN